MQKRKVRNVPRSYEHILGNNRINGIPGEWTNRTSSEEWRTILSLSEPSIYFLPHSELNKELTFTKNWWVSALSFCERTPNAIFIPWHITSPRWGHLSFRNRQSFAYCSYNFRSPNWYCHLRASTGLPLLLILVQKYHPPVLKFKPMLHHHWPQELPKPVKRTFFFLLTNVTCSQVVLAIREGENFPLSFLFPPFPCNA